MPKVSVIIPAYNSERYIRQTLESVINQSFGDFEAIVIDDGSTDRTSDEVAAVQEPRVRYIKQSNRGPAAARNVGLRSARGRYLVFLDSDDVWHPDMLRTCVEVLDRNPAVGCVHTNYGYIDGDGVPVDIPNSWQPWSGNVFNRLLVDIVFGCGALVWRREYFDRLGGLDETPELNDDWVNWLRIAHSGCLFDYVDQRLAFFRRHDHNLTLQHDRILGWRLKALDRIVREYDDIPDAVVHAAYAKVYLIGAVNSLRAGQGPEAATRLAAAAVHRPVLLQEPDTYFDLVYAGRPYGKGAEQFVPDLEKERTVILGLLDWLFCFGDLPAALRQDEKKIRGAALFSLAQLAYGALRHDARPARQLLRQAAACHWKSLRQPRKFGIALRIMIGSPHINEAKWLRAFLFSKVSGLRTRLHLPFARIHQI